ncbi:MAG: hypothetical protein AVDCRST_MAG68-1304, partial [uncultured Gemmatimonadetes bacterium]
AERTYGTVPAPRLGDASAAPAHYAGAPAEDLRGDLRPVRASEGGCDRHRRNAGPHARAPPLTTDHLRRGSRPPHQRGLLTRRGPGGRVTCFPVAGRLRRFQRLAIHPPARAGLRPRPGASPPRPYPEHHLRAHRPAQRM